MTYDNWKTRSPDDNCSDDYGGQACETPPHDRCAMVDEAAIEALAIKLWNEREKEFPGFVRMSWDEGSTMARNLMLMHARRLLTSGPAWDMPLFATRADGDLDLDKSPEKRDV